MSTMTESQSRNSGATDRPQQGARGVKVTPDAVRTRAYQIYQTRNSNGASDDPLSDWLQAECEIKVLSRGELLKGDHE